MLFCLVLDHPKSHILTFSELIPNRLPWRISSCTTAVKARLPLISTQLCAFHGLRLAGLLRASLRSQYAEGLWRSWRTSVNTGSSRLTPTAIKRRGLTRVVASFHKAFRAGCSGRAGEPRKRRQRLGCDRYSDASGRELHRVRPGEL